MAQILIVRSWLAVAKSLPSGENAMARMLAWCAGMLPVDCQVATSHIWSKPVSLPAISDWLSGEKPTARIPPPGLCSLTRFAPVATSQTSTTQSQPATANILPSGE